MNNHKTKFLGNLFLFYFFVNSLAAYAFINIPLTWIANIIALLSFFFVRKKIIFEVKKFLNPLLFIVLLGVVLNFLEFYSGTVQSKYPAFGTTPYSIYVLLRYLSIFSFIVTVYVVYELCKDKNTTIINGIIIIGILVSLYSAYCYFAQLTGLPEIPRTRIGTSGIIKTDISFTYGFHRAIGPFREPSHLAEWLILPLSLILSKNNISKLLKLFVIMIFLLTGSFGAISSLFLGVIFFYTIFRKSRFLTKSSYVYIYTLLGFLIISAMLDQISSSSAIYQRTLLDRFEGFIYGGGIESTNRNYIYQYIDLIEFPILGLGFGNPNILFARFLMTNNVASFLNIYINIWLSVGLIGLLLFIYFLIKPIFISALQKNTVKITNIFVLIAYLSYFFIYLSLEEELTINFAVVFALVIAQVNGYHLFDE